MARLSRAHMRPKVFFSSLLEEDARGCEELRRSDARGCDEEDATRRMREAMWALQSQRRRRDRAHLVP